MPAARPRLALVLADEPPVIPLERLLAARPVDVVLTLGDLSRDALAPLVAFAGPKLGVHGNHDDGGELAAAGIEDLHLRRRTLGGLAFAGFSGSLRYRPGPRFAFSQDEAAELLDGLPRADVLLAHSPPLGVNDEPGDPVHAGLRGLAEYLRRAAPALLLHGHTYPVLPRSRSGATRVLYVRGHAFVALP